MTLGALSLLFTTLAVCGCKSKTGSTGPTTSATATSSGAAPAAPKWTQIAMGMEHACALGGDGAVVCWGKKTLIGQSAAPGDAPFQFRPAPLAGLPKVAALHINFSNSCVVTIDERAFCWEDRPGEPNAPQPAPVPNGVHQIALGLSHGCALKTDGSVMCWGTNDDGQLGDGTKEFRKGPVDVKGLTKPTAVAAGAHFACALAADGSVSCWGDGRDGQLGPGKTDGSPTPVKLAGISDATQITARSDGACALRRAGGVVCWGDMGGEDGKLEPVKDLSNIVEVQTSGSHACARNDKGALWCWGDAEHGATGTGPALKGPEHAPIQIAEVKAVTALDLDSSGTCVITDGGAGASCWGIAYAGRLGNGASTIQPAPVKVAGVVDATQLALYGNYSCALHRDGSISCWGGKRNGIAGVARRFPPRKLKGSAELKTLTASGGFLFGVDDQARVTRWFWGAGADAPGVPIAGLEGVAALHGRVGHVFAALQNGKLAAVWLGWTDEEATVQSVLGVSNATNIVTSGCEAERGSRCTRMCTIRKNGRLACVRYHRKIGAKASAVPTRGKPEPALDVDDVKMLALRGSRGCAARGDGSLVCWKHGDGDDAPEPTVITSIEDAIDVTMGNYDGEHVCAVVKSGKVLCWTSDESNSSGFLGVGTLEHHAEPKPVVGISDAVSVRSTGDHVCAIHRDGTVSCWGKNGNDQVGTKLAAIAFKPVAVAF